MKKFVILLFVAMAALSAKAQVYVGGTVALWHNVLPNRFFLYRVFLNTFAFCSYTLQFHKRHQAVLFLITLIYCFR